MLADVTRRVSSGVVLPEIGDPFMGGFYAGIIDTTRPGSIISADAYQDGLRYALIVSPKSLEGGRDTGTGDLRWRTSPATVSEAQTRWDGLTVTRDVMTSSTYPAGNYCNGLSYPDDGASQWYLPALDEMESVYRNLKPSDSSNDRATSRSSTFPPSAHSWNNGANQASDPPGDPYEWFDPAQTDVAAFQSGGDEAISNSHHFWVCTWSSSSFAWGQHGSDGAQSTASQYAGWTSRVRPIRRLIL